MAVIRDTVGKRRGRQASVKGMAMISPSTPLPHLQVRSSLVGKDCFSAHAPDKTSRNGEKKSRISREGSVTTGARLLEAQSKMKAAEIPPQQSLLQPNDRGQSRGEHDKGQSLDKDHQPRDNLSPTSDLFLSTFLIIFLQEIHFCRPDHVYHRCANLTC